MPHDLKLLVTGLALALLPLLVFALRPKQSRSVSPAAFRLGAKDPFFYVLFRPDGLPRKYSWLFPIGIALLFVGVVWLVPSART
jgi:hypothetical protein